MTARARTHTSYILSVQTECADWHQRQLSVETNRRPGQGFRTKGLAHFLGTFPKRPFPFKAKKNKKFTRLKTATQKDNPKRRFLISEQFSRHPPPWLQESNLYALCFSLLLFIDTETVNAFLCLRQFLRCCVLVLSVRPAEILVSKLSQL